MLITQSRQITSSGEVLEIRTGPDKTPGWSHTCWLGIQGMWRCLLWCNTAERIQYDIYWQGFRSQYLNGLGATSVNMLWYLIRVRMLLSGSCIDTWYQLSSNQRPGYRLSANQSPDIRYPRGPGSEMFVITMASSHIAEGQLFRYYLHAAQWAAVTNNNRSFDIIRHLSMCHRWPLTSDHPQVRGEWRRKDVPWVDQNPLR